MPLNYKILEKSGTTSERLRQIFTASPGTLQPDATDEQKEENQKDCEVRRQLEDMIASRIDESILRNLKASHMIAAVDLAWDSSVINKQTVPLVLYAQGRIDARACVNSLEDLQCTDRYVKKGKDGKATVQPPKFTEVNINMLRSVISRRVAAQSARYSNLYPFFRYDGRGTDEVSKLRADLMSQRSDIMADQFGYREQQVQWIRDMLLYPFCMVFPSCRWQRDVEWIDENQVTDEALRTPEPRIDTQISREGVPLITPHPSRVFADAAYPIQSINTDSGCEWFGFWDVIRYGAILDNPDYFNRSEVSYGGKVNDMYSAYTNYFRQYYTTISPPAAVFGGMAAGNDRQGPGGNFDFYSGAMRDSSVFITHFYLKLTPIQWRMGRYPWPVWVHLTVANSRTVVHAEIMPDCPGFVFSYNTSAQRAVNLSMAHELMPFQDQLTNLLSQLLECCKRDLYSVAMLNLDAFPKENEGAAKALEEFREAMRNENYYAAVSILEVSLIKMRDLGVNMDSVFKVVHQQTNSQISVIITSINQVMMMAERVMALSPQEQGQISPRETSATEVQIVAGTTENVYQFISDAIDNGRSALKRYLYNSLISFGYEQVRLPVTKRYRSNALMEAGFKVEGGNEAGAGDTVSGITVIGARNNLVSEYVFTTRDGAERASNVQSAQTLVQLLGILMQPVVLQKLTNEQFSDILNTIFRQSGSGTDVVIEPQPGTETQPVMGAPQEAAAVPAQVPAEAMGQALPTS